MAERPDEGFDFEAFTRSHYAGILAYLLARTRNLEVAQDLAQETFLQAYRSRHAYDPERARPKEWVMGIARNVSAYAARRKSAQVQKFALLESLAEGVWKDRRPRAEVDERLSALRRCLQTLTERARQIIELLYEAGFTYQEVSEQLGMGSGAVKVAAFRARQALLECIRKRLAAARSGA